jgi:hypothetical protein
MIMQNYPHIGVQVGEILLPDRGIDIQKWAVIACDQFTSQPEYWKQVEEIVGDSPSTLELILPEVYLNTPEETRRIQSTQSAMQRYQAENVLQPQSGLILVERVVDGKTRRGLMFALDLDRYDFTKGSQSLIRATEGTIIDRLPPRIRIREGALLEVPHILVLIDDPERTVIEPLVGSSNLQPLYDVELMLGSGHLSGQLVKSRAEEAGVIQALEKLADPKRFHQKYGVGEEHGVLLFAVGDGNHSLATAKSIWEKIKYSAGPDHPARYALVEIENVHDEGLNFEPIHRVVFNVPPGWKNDLVEFFQGKVEIQPAAGLSEMIETVKTDRGPGQSIGLISTGGFDVINIEQPLFNLAVGSVQSFLDAWLKDHPTTQVDYVHGDDVAAKLGSEPGNLAFYLPAMDKNELFRTVILDGSLPRKTFSMGEAHQKRFYMESRRIR